MKIRLKRHEKKISWGYLGILALMGFQAFIVHNPWLLFFFGFLAFFEYFHRKQSKLPYFLLLGLAGILFAFLAVAGIVHI